MFLSTTLKKKHFLLAVLIIAFVVAVSQIIVAAPSGQYHPISELWINSNIAMDGKSIVNAGRVGIGTNSPSDELHVVGDTSLDGDLDISGAITLPTTGISGAGSGSGLDADTVDGYETAELMAAGGGGSCPVFAGTFFESGGEPYYCKKKTINSTGYVIFNNINEGKECDSSRSCRLGTCGLDIDGDGWPVTGGDCDDNCATCYPGSTHFTISPDGKDQDCNGIVDDFTGGDGRIVLNEHAGSCDDICSNLGYPACVDVGTDDYATNNKEMHYNWLFPCIDWIAGDNYCDTIVNGDTDHICDGAEANWLKCRCGNDQGVYR